MEETPAETVQPSRLHALLDQWWDHELAVAGYSPCRGGCRDDPFPCEPRRQAENQLSELGENPRDWQLRGFFTVSARAKRGKGPW